jgi:membrane protein DedA with SNARE-associated domain/pimeloyl-ACP methyl ester carboxylesterase
MTGRRSAWARRRWWWLIYLLLLAGHQLGGFADRSPGLAHQNSEATLRVRWDAALGDSTDVSLLRRGSPVAAPLLYLSFDPAPDLDEQLEESVAAGEVDLWTVDLRTLARRVATANYETLSEPVIASLRQVQPRSLSVVASGDAAAVAMYVARALGDEVDAFVLWGASGVQEFDLLGSHEMNHLLYSLEWTLLTAVNEFVPHFGLLSPMAKASQDARIRMQSDRRALRKVLAQIDVPVLIVHRIDDPHVGVSVAREHARILPHSELQIVSDSGTQRPQLSSWLELAREGRKNRRADASADRVADAQAELGRGEWVRAHGRTLALLIFLLVLGTFITEDLTSIAAGLLIAEGRLTWAQGLGAVFCGIYFGDQALYLLGRIARRNVVHRRPWKWFLRAEDLDRAARWFEQRGLAAIVLTRFIPGMRLPTYVAAGVVRAGYWRFAAYFFVAVALWTPLLVGFSARVGAEALGRLHDFRKGSLLVFGGLALAILLLLRLVVPLCTDRGRRSLWAQWQRIRRWEFWPPALVYGPVLPRILLMAIRHRSLRVVTAVNPGMPAGGLMGESKVDFFDAMGVGSSKLPLYRRIPPGSAAEQRTEIEAFLASAGVQLPIVIKPDIGERGLGVVILRELSQLDEVLTGSEMTWIAQAYVEGLEFGVFYVREPGAEMGRILSVNSKERLRLVGDGVHDLEHLIVHDSRATILAGVHLRANSQRLAAIPALGEEVEIVEVGAHARGTVFRDARQLITPELTQAIDSLSRRFEGFSFGRYDLKVPDEQALREGRDFWVIEVNGLTSEAAHIYEPGFPLGEARQTLAEQWRLAYEIGAANVVAGHRPATWREILELWSTHRQRRHQGPPTH